MHHCIHVWTIAVDEQVHGDFARHIPVTVDALSQCIDDDQVLGRHHALAHHGRRTQKVTVTQAHGDVAVRRGHKTGLVQKFPVADDLVPVFEFGGHAPGCW